MTDETKAPADPFSPPSEVVMNVLRSRLLTADMAQEELDEIAKSLAEIATGSELRNTANYLERRLVTINKMLKKAPDNTTTETEA